MSDLLRTLGVGAATFAATNVDDLVLLAAWFADRTLAVRTVVLGQLLGIATLVAGSAVAATVALAVPHEWLRWLGLVPLLLGVRTLLRRRDEPAEAGDDVAPARPAAGQVAAVAAVTIANGGDNLAVYMPVFASEPRVVPIHAALFLVMTLLWCALGRVLVRNPLAGARVQRSGHAALPFVLIGLGVLILVGLGP